VPSSDPGNSVAGNNAIVLLIKNSARNANVAILLYSRLNTNHREVMGSWDSIVLSHHERIARNSR
jgi:hypothetical protein